MSFTIVFNNQSIILDKPTPILEIVGNSKDIVCAKVNNRLRELTYLLDKDATVIPLTCKDRDARQIYEPSLRYLVAMAMNNIKPGIDVRFSYNVSRSVFMELLDENEQITSSLLEELEKEMNRLVSLDLPLTRKVISKEECKKIYEKAGFKDKIDILEYRPEVTAHVYECDGYKNYMYNRMVPSTGYINRFKLRLYNPGLLIQYPRPDSNGEIPPFEDDHTFGKTLKRAHQWAKATGCDTIVGINKRIEQDGDFDFITLCEQRHNRQLCELGEMIEDGKDDIRLICIAGPSSSGKTTFANRLRIELLSRGIEPIRISLDDYYRPKSEAPLDDNGEPDLESIEALDIDLFNKNMTDLISGDEVELPHFDFKVGHRVPGRVLKVPKNQPIIIEGIHALNERVTQSIPNHQKFKIFIAPQAQVNIDNHNPLSLTDLRLLRRIVRDYQFRGSSATETIGMWANVRKGEFKWIYGTQEGANYVFNSFSCIELSVMKEYAMPLLNEIEKESEFYPVAERLIRMLKFFKSVSPEWIPCNSIIREFIGGSCYEE